MQTGNNCNYYKTIYIFNSGRDAFPLLLKRQKLPKKFSLNQPGQTSASSYITPDQIKVRIYVDLD